MKRCFFSFFFFRLCSSKVSLLLFFCVCVFFFCFVSRYCTHESFENNRRWKKKNVKAERKRLKKKRRLAILVGVFFFSCFLPVSLGFKFHTFLYIKKILNPIILFRHFRSAHAGFANPFFLLALFLVWLDFTSPQKTGF